MAQPERNRDQVVIVLASSAPPRQFVGVHTGSRYDSVGITIQIDEEQPLAFESGEAVILVRDGPDGRAAVRATFLRFDGDRVWFEAPGNEWPPVIERWAKRVAVDKVCDVLGATRGECVSGNILDLSEGGARISVPKLVDDSQLYLKFVEGEESVTLPAVLLNQTEEQDHAVIRVRFESLPQSQQIWMRRYIDQWGKGRRSSTRRRR